MASHAALLIISNRQSAPAATPSTPDGDTDSTPPGVPQSSSDPTCRRPLQPPVVDHPPASRRHCPTPKMASHAALLIISNRQSAPAATPSTLDTDTDSTPPGIPQSSSDPTCRRPLQHRSLTTLLPPKDTVQPFQDGSPGALWVVGDHQSAQRTPSKLPVAIRTQPVPDTPIHLQPDLPAAFATPVIDHPPASRRHCPTPR